MSEGPLLTTTPAPSWLSLLPLESHYVNQCVDQESEGEIFPGEIHQTRSILPQSKGKPWAQRKKAELLGLHHSARRPAGSQALEARQAGSPSHRLNLRLGAVVLAMSQHPA